MYRSEEEWKELSGLLKEVYFSNRWSYYGGGKFHSAFEQLASEKLFEGRVKILLVANGTVALELAIRAAFHAVPKPVKLGIPVLTVPMVKFAAERSECIDEIKYLDVDPKTFCIRKIPRNLDGLIWVHTGGLMSEQTETMLKECKRQGTTVIEDVSHAYASSYKDGRPAGTIGHFVAGSLFGTKVLTCGEGGLVGTHSKIGYSFMKAMRNQGKNDEFEQVMEGYNYRASEFTAAIAFTRLKWFEKEYISRYKITNWYDVMLGKAGIQSVENELGCITAGYKYIVRTKHAHKLDERMEKEGFSFTDWVHDKLLAQGDFPGAEEIADGHVCLQLIEDFLERNRYINMFERLWKEINK